MSSPGSYRRQTVERKIPHALAAWPREIFNRRVPGATGVSPVLLIPSAQIGSTVNSHLQFDTLLEE
jgi:hypothetical protein